MPVRLGRFEMPKRLTKEESSASPTYAKFVAEPFETGFGHTVGNSLRRVLLSSLEGSAITSVKIDGAMHEFTTVDGVVEDVTDIVLNLKKVRFKTHSRETQTLLLSASKEGAVTAGDIQLNQNVELVNPDQHICTRDADHLLGIGIVAEQLGGAGCGNGRGNHGRSLNSCGCSPLFGSLRRLLSGGRRGCRAFGGFLLCGGFRRLRLFSHRGRQKGLVGAGLGIRIALHTDRTARTLAGAGVGLGALAAHRQSPKMAVSAIRLDRLKALQVDTDFAAQVAFDDILALLDRVHDQGQLGFGKIFCAGRGINPGLGKNLTGINRTEAVNVAEGNIHPLLARNINT